MKPPTDSPPQCQRFFRAGPVVGSLRLRATDVFCGASSYVINTTAVTMETVTAKDIRNITGPTYQHLLIILGTITNGEKIQTSIDNPIILLIILRAAYNNGFRNRKFTTTTYCAKFNRASIAFCGRVHKRIPLAIVKGIGNSWPETSTGVGYATFPMPGRKYREMKAISDFLNSARIHMVSFLRPPIKFRARLNEVYTTTK